MNKFIAVFFPLVFFSVLIPVDATADPEINYDKKSRLLSIRANNVSFVAILRDVEKKTGIKITFLGGVPDKYVTLNMKQLPITKIDNLLDGLGLTNNSLIYDKRGNISEIIILPEGKTYPQPYRSKGYR